MKNSRSNYLLAAAAGLSLIGSAAGCSANGGTGAGQPGPDAGAGSSTGTDGSSADGADSDGAGSGEYADGTYTAVGSYESPNGTETIDVRLTINDNQVADVAVTSNPTNPYTKRFQGEFVDGIHEVVVGKPIDELNVSRVGGSSLTSGGFRDAVEQIRAEAQL